MKKLLIISTFITLALSLLLGGCKKDDTMEPVIEPMEIDNYDLIQVSNDNPDIPVVIAYNDDRSIDSIQINVYKLDETEPIARNVIRNLTHSSTSRTVVKTPFPFPDVAPNGVYTIEYTITDKAGKTSKQSYNINVLNNKIQNICTFPSMALPNDKNVYIRVTSTQPLAANEDIYVTGSFEADNGGSGDWTGGNNTFKLNRLNGSNQCFYIALNLTTAHEFKFTLGNWDKEALDNSGGTPSNAKWNGQSSQDIIIYNWKGKPVVNQTIPQVLPSAGIVSGKMSVIANVNSTDDNGIKYYLVKKGGDLNDKSNPMHRIMDGANATTRVIGAVPKDAAAEYVVVKEVNGVVKEQANQWGFALANPIVAKWDGETNPVNVSIAGFTGEGAPPENLFVVGGATPGGWSNPVPVPQQQFTKVAPGKFELTLPLTSGQAYVLLPVNGSWDAKFGGTEKQTGAIVPQGGDIPAPDESGTYKIVVDFTTGRYTLTKQ